MEKIIYMTYDLGVNGDYPGLYTWLAKLDAQECGENSCRFIYDFKNVNHDNSNDDTKKALEELQAEAKRNVKLKVNDRIYVNSDFFVNGTKRSVGAFIVGKRKQNPWQGYKQEDAIPLTLDE